MRVEEADLNNQKKYYLVKDIRVGARTAKIKKYLGVKAPSPGELAAYERKFALGLELKAAEAAGRLGTQAYKAKYLKTDQISALEELRYMAKLTSDILSNSELRAYEEQFEVEYVQGTTAIEGNTLTLGETADLLLHSIVPKTRSLREINEVQNFKSVKAFRNKYKGRITLAFIKKLHALIMHNIDEESASSFRRTDDVGILGADISLCPSMLIGDELERITTDHYKRLKEGYHPFEEAVVFHYAFEAIHPFADGNGRIGREIFNYMLNKNGYPRLLFPGKNCSDYIEALRHGNEGRYAEMVSAFANLAIDQKTVRENIKKILGDT